MRPIPPYVYKLLSQAGIWLAERVARRLIRWLRRRNDGGKKTQSPPPPQ